MLLAHFAVQLFHRLLLLVELDYQFVLFGIERDKFLLANTELTLSFHCILFNLLREINESLQLFLEILNFSVSLRKLLLVLDRLF